MPCAAFLKYNLPMLTTTLASVATTSEAGYAQVISTSSHEIRADEPVRHGGTNTGASPFELLLSALGACTAITLRMYAERKKWDLGTVRIKLKIMKDGDTLKIERTISTSAALDGGQQTKLLEIADKTPVTRALATGVAVQTMLGSAV